MLSLKLSVALEELRSEFKTWLKKNPPPKFEGVASLETVLSAGRKWQKQLAAGRWLGVYWPEEYGGRGLSLTAEAVIQEELARTQSPQIPGLFGITMVGPVLIKHGTTEQKKKFLPKILSGEVIWCPGLF